MSTKIFHERYKRIHDRVPYYFYLDSNKLEEDFQWIVDHQIESIRLVPDLYKLKSIEPILELTQLKYLAVFLKDIDLSKLNSFSKLQNLVISELNFNIDISGLCHLEELYLLYHQHIKGLETLKNLKQLTLIKGEIVFFKEGLFKYWENMNELTLLSPELPDNLSFLKHQIKLKELEIHNSRSKFNVSELKHLKRSLEILKIGNCKRVTGIEESLPFLSQLRWFVLTDSTILKDAKFIELIPNLEVLIVLGSSYFENGDVSNLKRLNHVSIDDKRHYNLKSKDFVSKIRK